jgi:hypothetical protein
VRIIGIEVSHISKDRQKLEQEVTGLDWDFKVSSISPHPVIEYMKKHGSRKVGVQGQRLADGSLGSDQWVPAFYNPFMDDLKLTAKLVVEEGKKGYVTRAEIEDIVTRDSYDLLRKWDSEWLKNPKDYKNFVKVYHDNNRMVADFVCKDRKLPIVLYEQTVNEMLYGVKRRMNLMTGILVAGVVLFAATVVFFYGTYRAEREQMKEDGQRIERMVNYNIQQFKKEYNVDDLIKKKVLPLFKKEKEMTMDEAEKRLRALLKEEGITQEGQIDTIRTAVFEDGRVKNLLKLADQLSGN